MPIQSAVGHSDNLEDPYEAGLEICDRILQKVDLQTHSIGILFCNINFDFAELLRAIADRLDIPIIGCTTAAEANDDGYFEESASLMVITGEEIKIGLGLGQELSKDPKEAVRKAYNSASSMLGDKPKLALTFPDASMSVSAEYVLQLLEQEMGREVPIAGALPADNFQFKKTFQFCNDAVCSDSIPVLLLSGDIKPQVITRSGWIPIGAKAKATRVASNILYEIDHQPAIEYLKKYIPDPDDPVIMASYPMAILDDSLGEDAGRYAVVRSPFFYEKESGAVRYMGDIPENASIQMARASREDALAGAAEAIATLKEKAADRELNTLLCFSCAARKLVLGLETKREIETLLKALPSSCAVNGFYAYGEIGPIDNSLEHLKGNRFHNCTLVLCAL